MLRSLAALPQRGTRMLAALFMATALSPAPARAASTVWRAAVNGSAGVAANWNPAFVPGAADIAFFTLGGAYTVSWAAPQDTLAGLDVTVGTPAMSIASNLGVRNFAFVENGGILSIAAGRVRSNQWIVGHAGAGRLIVSGSGCQAVSVSPDAPTEFGDTTGTFGAVHVQGEGQFISNSWYSLAPRVATTCSLTVAGGNALTHVGSRVSTLTAAGGGDRGGMIVANGGTARVDVFNGGFVDLKGPLVVARRGTGTLRVYKTAGILTPGMNVAGTTSIGFEPTALLAGIGLLSLEAGAIRLGGGCTIGDADHISGNGDHGTLRVQGSSVILGGPISMPSSLAGELELRNGTVQLLSGNSTIQQSTPFAVSSSVGSPTLWIEGTATVQVSPAPGSTIALGVGRGGAGRVRVAGPSTVLNALGDLALADSLGGAGVVEVDSSATLVVANSLQQGATGTLDVRGGGTFQVGLELLAQGTILLGNGTLFAPTGVLSGTTTLSGHGLLNGSWVNSGSIVIPVGDTLLAKGTLVSVQGTIAGGGTVQVTQNQRFQAVGELGANVVLTQDAFQPYGFTDVPQSRTNGAAAHPAASEDVPVAVLGHLHIGGDLTLIGACSTTMRIAARVAGMRDTLTVDGQAQLSGVLRLFTVPGLEPSVGDTITVLDAGGVSGTFSSITVNGIDPAGVVVLEYGPTSVKVIYLGSTGVGPGPAIGAAFTEVRLVPVRTRGTAAFALELPARSRVSLAVYDVSGRQVARLADGMIEAGRHEFGVPAGRLASGMYFARAVVEASDGVRVKTARAVVVR